MTATASAPADLTAALTNPTSLAGQRDRIALVTAAASRAGSYIANAADRAVAPTEAAVAALDAFRRPLQAAPRASREVLTELAERGSPATVVSTHGRYFGYVNGGTHPAGQAAAILAGAWDQNAAMHGMSPIAATLDEVAGEWVVEALGLPSTARASFTAGATVANVTAIIAARDELLRRAGWDVGERGLAGAPALRIVVGAEAHASVVKSLRLAGFGAAQVEAVPTDANGAIDAAAFPTDTDDRTLVILQAGNVNTGHSDPFADIVPGVRERGGWVHVDGAFGLWAAAAPALAHHVAGVELADSWATDAHKWLNAPYDSGIVIVRDEQALLRAMRAEAAYIEVPDGEAPAAHRGIQMSQRARGVEAWAVLAALGRYGLAELIERTSALAACFAATLDRAGAELLAPVVLNQALVAFGDDDTTRRVIAEVQRDGVLWAGGTTWHGRAAMRLSVSDLATTADDVDVSADAIVAAWHRVRR